MPSNEDATERTLDVRDIDGEPFDDIMQALARLPEGERLLLINSFEPEPLYAVIEDRGFTYDASQEAPDEWHVAITHQ